ncbi:MAG: hypothetical protein AAFX87_25960 [Bacteroidota bacterium]
MRAYQRLQSTREPEKEYTSVVESPLDSLFRDPATDMWGEVYSSEMIPSGKSKQQETSPTDDDQANNTLALTSAVGKNAGKYQDKMNYAPDVRAVQDKLLEIGLLAEADYIKERPMETLPLKKIASKVPEGLENLSIAQPEASQEVNTTPAPPKQVSDTTLKATIAAIVVFQREVKNGDHPGYIYPQGGTVNKLAEATAESVAEARAAYQAEVEEKKRQAALAKQKEEERLAKEAEEKRKAEEQRKAEEARIAAIKNEPATTENAERFVKARPDMLRLGDDLLAYVSLNPDFVLKVFNYLGRTEKDNLAYVMANHASDELLKTFDHSVLKIMKSAMEAWFVSYDSSAYGKHIRRINAILNPGEKEGSEVEEKKETAEVEKLDNFKLTGSVGKGGDNKVDDVILVQKFLVQFDYLGSDCDEISKTNSAKEQGKDNVEEEGIPKTIDAIQEYQKYGSSVSFSKGKQKSVWQGDGNIGKGGLTEISMRSMTNIHNAYDNEPFLEEEKTVLKDDQWRSQFRYGYNFYTGQKELDYIKYVTDLTKYNDANELHKAKQKIIDQVKDHKDFKDDGKWFNQSEIKENSISTSDKTSKDKGNRVSCYDAAKKMLSFTGAEPQGKNTKIQTFLEEVGKDGEFTKQAALGIKYIDGQLRQGKAVFVAIDKADEGKVQRNEGTTDHFIVIMGKGKDKKGWYFRYFDPGTGNKKEKGISTENKLYISKDRDSAKSNKYNLSQIRINNE